VRTITIKEDTQSQQIRVRAHSPHLKNKVTKAIPKIGPLLNKASPKHKVDFKSVKAAVEDFEKRFPVARKSFLVVKGKNEERKKRKSSENPFLVMNQKEQK